MSDDPLRPASPPPPPPPVPVAPRPVVPIDESELSVEGEPPRPVSVPGDTGASMPVAEPGVVAPAPFANVYSPPAVPVARPASMSGAAAAPPGYYPPPATWPAAPPPGVGYRSADAHAFRRPGIITTLAILGIVFAAMSVIASLFTGCTGLMVVGFSQTATAVGGAAVIPAPGGTAAANSPGVNGLDAAERAVVVDAMKTKAGGRLSVAGEQQLDHFLAEHGRLVFAAPQDGTTLTPADVAADVTKAARIAGGGHVFTIQAGKLCPTAGRLTVKDQNTLFESDDNATQLRSRYVFGQTAPLTPAAVMTPLSADQAQKVVNRVRTVSGRLSEPQAATIASLLQGPSFGNWVENVSNDAGLTSQVKSAVATSDGSITVTFTMGTMTLDAQGQLAGGVPPPATAPAAAGPVMPNPFAVQAKVTRGSYSLVILDAALSILIAIFLLVISILALRHTPGGRGLFLTYALVKLACAVLGILGMAWTVSQLNASVAANNGLWGGFMIAQCRDMTVTSLIVTSVGALFPIVVLGLLLFNKTVREYYAPARA